MPLNMKYLPILLWGCVSVQMIPACTLRQETADTRFITFVHEEKEPIKRAQAWKDDKYQRFLIAKILLPQWHIVYNIPDACNSSEAKTNIVKAIEQALRQWLKPLRTISNLDVVDAFVFTELPTYDNADNEGDEFERIFSPDDIKKIDPHLQIVFYCEKGRSYAYRWFREIHMHAAKELDQDLRINGTPYHLATLLHEIGHAFGLSDTYVEDDEGHSRFGILSSGAFEHTIGKQPYSVMAGMAYAKGDPDQDILLGKDDIEGILWLYRYFHEQDIDTNICPTNDYELEVIDAQKKISGCRPRYPLIFELKQGHLRPARWLIRNAWDIEINAQDQDGNTALHYAALWGYCSITRDLLAKSHIDKNIVNNDGYTALQYAEENKHHRVAALLRGERIRCRPGKSLCSTIGVRGNTNPLALLLLLALPALLYPVLRRKWR